MRETRADKGWGGQCPEMQDRDTQKYSRLPSSLFGVLKDLDAAAGTNSEICALYPWQRLFVGGVPRLECRDVAWSKGQ